MIIDSDKLSREFYCIVARQVNQHVSCRCYSSTLTALRMFFTGRIRPAVILLNNEMPAPFKTDWLTYIAGDPSFIGIPVIAIYSGRLPSNDSDHVNLYFIHRPVESGELKDLLHDLLK